MGKLNCTPAFQPNTYTSEDELLYPVPNNTTTFNPYESPGPYHNTNLMYTRLVFLRMKMKFVEQI